MKKKFSCLVYIILSSCLTVSFVFAENETIEVQTEFVEATMTVDGIERDYLLYKPDDLPNFKIPLVILLHGASSDAQVMAERTPYRVWLEIADREKLLVVLPNGTRSRIGRTWNDCRGDSTSNSTVDDVGFISDLIDHLAEQDGVDPKRVYVSGTSNGGHMTTRLAFEIPDKIAAIAPVVAGVPAVPCTKAKGPMSVLFINGTNDPLKPYEGGKVGPFGLGGRGTVLSAQKANQFWLKKNKMQAVEQIREFPDLYKNDNSVIQSKVYTDPQARKEVIEYTVIGGGHAEPSIKVQYPFYVQWILGQQNHDLEMAEIVWAFFKEKSL